MINAIDIDQFPGGEYDLVVDGKHYSVLVREANDGKRLPAKITIGVRRVFLSPTHGAPMIRSLTPVRTDTVRGRAVLRGLARKLELN